MVKLTTSLGAITLTNEYFANLVGSVASSCYGVVGMVNKNPVEGLRSLLFGSDFPEKGVKVSQDSNRLEIEIHIKVLYGLNITAIVKSISNKVRYAVENATGLQVETVNVSVDEMLAE